MRELEGVFMHQGLTAYTETRPRQGLACVFSLDVTHWNGPGGQTLTAKIESRNTDDTTWDVLGTQSITGAGVSPFKVTNIKELWRLSLAVSGGSSATVIYIAKPLMEGWREYV